jgi:hypothetical protein
MSLKIGAWQMNENGAEGTLNINNVDSNSGARFEKLAASPAPKATDK